MLALTSQSEASASSARKGDSAETTGFSLTVQTDMYTERERESLPTRGRRSSRWTRARSRTWPSGSFHSSSSSTS